MSLMGDTSGNAAAALESALLLEPGRDSEADEELLYVLSLYQPRAVAPYAGPDELEAAIRHALGDSRADQGG